MNALVFTNHAGTMSDSFSIGKKGITVLQNNGDPAGVEAPAGSLYVRKDTAKLYQLDSAKNWNPILNLNSITTANGVSVALKSNGNLELSLSPNPEMAGVEGVVFPKGQTSERPSNATEGTTRYNTTTKNLEVYDGNAWVNYSRTTILVDFTDNDLIVDAQGSTKWITVSHNLGEMCPQIQLWDNYYNYTYPYSAVSTDPNTVQVGVVQASLTISGTWHVRVSK